jgi:hypothetical protein
MHGRCVTRRHFNLNALLHTSQPAGRSALCMRWWVSDGSGKGMTYYTLHKHKGANQYVCTNVLSDGSGEGMPYSTLAQIEGRSLVCVRWWIVRWLWRVYVLLHTAQL